MTVVLDAGALIGIDRRDRRIAAILRVAQRERRPVRSGAAVVSQVWRDGARQANLARVLTGIAVVGLDDAAGRRVGELLGRARSSDVPDGHVSLIADDRDTVLTSDAADIRRLLASRGVECAIVGV